MRKREATEHARHPQEPGRATSAPDSQTAGAGTSVLEAALPADVVPEAERARPWVQLKYLSYSTQLYPAMIAKASPDAQPGSLVTVYDKAGRLFGTGLYNPHARVPLRMLQHGSQPFTEEDFFKLLDWAVRLRLEVLRLPEVTDAFRVVHSDGDGLSGLVVDKFADVLSIEVHSLGLWQRLPRWLAHLHQRLETRHAIIEVDDFARRVERIPAPGSPPGTAPRRVKIREHGVLYEVDFAEGHKTGFFCDQRDNRLRLTRLLRPGQRVLDLCCYTGGFALAAAVLGKAGEVTGVDLDEKAIARARRNANLNRVRVHWIHCDAFSYARQMQRNRQQWDVVVVDPPKFVASREEWEEGRRRYEDLNGLAAALVAPGGLLVTCSCSGLVTAEDFETWVRRAVHRLNRRLQILDRTGAGPDHPVMSNCPEGRYLKVLWGRVW